MPRHTARTPAIDLGYHWFWTYGHLIPASIFGVAAVVTVALGAPWWTWAPAAAVAAWAFAGFLVMRFLVRMNEILDLPTTRFLPAGEGEVLDVGCGAGRVSIAVASSRPGVHVVGLDNFSAEYIHGHSSSQTERNFEIAGIAGRARVQAGDMREMPFGEASFDAAASSAAIDHLPPEAIRKTLGEVRRVLRPSGQFLLMVIVPNLWTAITFGPFVHRGFAGRAFWRDTLGEAGLALEAEGSSRGLAWFLARKPA